MKMIQIRNVPDDVHRTLKIRAAEAGMSLSEYLLRDIERSARRLTIDEVFESAKRAGPVEPPEDSATSVRSERDAH